MKKLTVVEIEEPLIWNKFFSFYAATWGVSVINDYSAVAAPELNLESIGLDIRRDVIMVTVGLVKYQEVSTISECITDLNGGIFYYDRTDKIVYIHFRDHKNPYQFVADEIFIGVALGFYKSIAFENGLIAGSLITGYDSRLTEAPEISSNLDNRVFQEQELISSQMALDNSDLAYKQFNVGVDTETGEIKRNKTGNYVRCMYWQGESEDDFSYTDLLNGIYFQGYIEKVSEGTEIKIDIRDLRKQDDVLSPSRLLVNANWPDRARPDRDLILPHTWGVLFDVPCICLNEKEDPIPAEYKFLVADAEHNSIDSINAVYLDGQLQSGVIAVPLYDLNENFAYFELDKSVFAVNDGTTTKYQGMNKITVDMDGYRDQDEVSGLLETTASIVREMMINDLGIQYTAQYFNLTEWSLFDDLGNKIGYYLDKPKEFYKKVGDIQKNEPLSQFEIQPDRKYTWKNFRYLNYSSSVQFKISSDDILGNGFIPTIDSDSSEVAAVLSIDHAKKWKEKTFETIEYDDNKDFARAKFFTDRNVSYETLIVPVSLNLETFRDIVLGVVGFSNDRHSITVDSRMSYNGVDILDKKAGEYFEVELNTEKDYYFGRVICQLLSLNLNEDNTVALDFAIAYAEPNQFRRDQVIGEGNQIIGPSPVYAIGVKDE